MTRFHEDLCVRAQDANRTLSEYVRDLLEREVGRRPVDGVFERVRGRAAVDLGRPAAELIAEERRG